MNQYDFSRYPQAARVNAHYAQQLKNNKKPLIIDCGGNIGLSAVWFLTTYPQAEVYVIEPDKDNLEVLRRNVAPFGNRVSILSGGVWNHSGYLQIVNPGAGPTAFRVEPVDQATAGDKALRCYTIEEVCTLAKNEYPLIVKVDIEGSQKALFSDNTAWVNRSDVIALELDDWLLPWQGTSRSFFKCLSQYEFDYLLNGESIFCFRDAQSDPG